MNALMWKDLVIKASETYNLDALLIYAVIQTESGGNPWAIRYEPAFLFSVDPTGFAGMSNITRDTEEILQKCSWGLMQIMGCVAREFGYQGQLTKLITPELAIQLGCKVLKKKAEKVGQDECSIYAAYNAGSVKKTKSGMFVNQRNVDAFWRNYRNLEKQLEEQK